MKMNRFLPVLMGMVCFLVHPVFSQSADSVTSDELQKYAVVMDSIDVMKQQLIDTITDMVQNNPRITAVRYNELYKIVNDSARLVEANATADEIAAVKEIVSKRNDGAEKINETFQSLAKDYLGAATYNKVRKALGSDPALKEKYDELLKTLKEEDAEGKKGEG